jgi:hypothetical protein
MLILNRLTTPPLNQFLTLSVPSSVPTTVSLPSVVPITAELSVKAEGRLCIVLAAKHRRTDFYPIRHIYRSYPNRYSIRVNCN